MPMPVSAAGPLPSGLTRDELVAEVARVLDAVPVGATVLVAVSGGPDSTALAHLTADARADLKLVLGYVGHGARDDRQDTAAVAAHARAVGAPLLTEEVSVEPAGAGWEAAARDQRYRALCRMAEEVAAEHVLLGHTAEDQAETVLLRVARGTGVDGLGAMEPIRDEDGIALVRPLLRVRRDDVRRFVALEGLEAVEDPMNRDPRFRRVRAREEVLPALLAVADDPVAALARLADLAREDAALLDAMARDAAGRVVRRYGPVRAVRAADLGEIGAVLARRVVRRMLAEVRAERLPVDAAHVDAVLSLEAGTAVDVPGASVTCGGGWVAAAPAQLPHPEPVPLEIPGRTLWPALGIEVVATVPAERSPGQLALPLPARWQPRADVPPETVPPGGDPQLGEVVLSRDDAAGELVLRSRRDGDRLRTGAGTRKLQDVLVDAGVPRAARDLVPIVVRGDDVVWVPGVAVDVDAEAAGAAAPHAHLALAASL
jgi:tRNA(Ile)-lysidine synthase